MPIEEGARAPAFALEGQDGKTVKLAEFKGKPVVLYFYPKDETPGCTREACSFRDHYRTLTKKGAVLLGVSKDSAHSHLKFAKKYDLPFPLLVDADHKVAEAYGAWGEKSLYGRKFMGLIRSTFLIGPDGRLGYSYSESPLPGQQNCLSSCSAEATVTVSRGR